MNYFFQKKKKKKKKNKKINIIKIFLKKKNFYIKNKFLICKNIK